MKKCGHCRRKVALSIFSNIKARDGSRLIACGCGKTWVRPAPATADSPGSGQGPREATPDVEVGPGTN